MPGVRELGTNLFNKVKPHRRKNEKEEDGRGKGGGGRERQRKKGRGSKKAQEIKDICC